MYFPRALSHVYCAFYLSFRENKQTQNNLDKGKHYTWDFWDTILSLFYPGVTLKLVKYEFD